MFDTLLEIFVISCTTACILILAIAIVKELIEDYFL